MSITPAVITGVGPVSAIGWGRNTFWDALLDGRHGFGPVTLWGWLAVGIGVAMLATAFGLFARSGMAALFAMTIAALNALMHLLAIGANTWWSILVIVVDLVIIFGLRRHAWEQ